VFQYPPILKYREEGVEKGKGGEGGEERERKKTKEERKRDRFD